ncbi:hypothetical protein PCAR4_260054 [Paraburkholderia caribensis]|nr:hypothetical protein PCAR4_260054 [Paraburkholderia caribensis]
MVGTRTAGAICVRVFGRIGAGDCVDCAHQPAHASRAEHAASRGRRQARRSAGDGIVYLAWLRFCQRACAVAGNRGAVRGEPAGGRAGRACDVDDARARCARAGALRHVGAAWGVAAGRVGRRSCAHASRRRFHAALDMDEQSAPHAGALPVSSKKPAYDARSDARAQPPALSGQASLKLLNQHGTAALRESLDSRSTAVGESHR